MAKAHITLMRAAAPADTGTTLPIPSTIVAASPPNAPLTANANTWTEAASGVSDGAVASLIVPEFQAGYHILDVAAIGSPVCVCLLEAGIDPNSAANLFESVRVSDGGNLSFGGLKPTTRAWIRDAVVS